MDGACLCHTIFECVPALMIVGQWKMCCRWDDFFGNCTSLLKRSCRVDIMVSACLSCSADTDLLPGPLACATASQCADYSSVGGPGCALLCAV